MFVNAKVPSGAILAVLGEGPVAVSEIKQFPFGLKLRESLGHAFEVLFDGLANSPAAAATAAAKVVIAPIRLFISVPPSGG